MIYLTSDLHLLHDKSFIWQPRGFKSIEEHDETIIANWNRIINDDDDVYILGDLILGDNDEGIEKLKRLKGKLHIIYGNHCTDTRKNRYSELPNLVEASYATMLRYGKWNFYLSHYPTIVGGIHNTKDKLWNLCGHSHTKDRFTDMEYKAYHVELDCHNNMPISIDDIILDIKEWRVLNNEIY